MANLQQIAKKFRVSDNFLNSKEDALLIVASSMVDLIGELNRNENGRLVDSNCGKTNCYGAEQVSTNSGIAFVLQGVPTGSNNDPMAKARWELGQLEAHEFTHAMQRATISGQPTKEWPTSWIMEGSAELAQNLVMSYKSYDEYMKWRKLDSSDLYGKNTKITSSFMTTYLDLKSFNKFFL